MEKFLIGMLVKSMAGHDEGHIFVLVALDSQFGWIADGKGRKVEKPKRKNRKHLQPVKSEIKEPVSNETVMEAIRAYRRS